MEQKSKQSLTINELIEYITGSALFDFLNEEENKIEVDSETLLSHLPDAISKILNKYPHIVIYVLCMESINKLTEMVEKDKLSQFIEEEFPLLVKKVKDLNRRTEIIEGSKLSKTK